MTSTESSLSGMLVASHLSTSTFRPFLLLPTSVASPSVRALRLSRAREKASSWLSPARWNALL